MSVTLKCPKHPRYTAKIAPKANCLFCIELYDLKQDYEVMIRKLAVPVRKGVAVPEGYVAGLYGPVPVDI